MDRVQKGVALLAYIWLRRWLPPDISYTGRLDQYGYRDILDNTLQKSRDLFKADGAWKFQQDNAPSHTARKITEYMTDIEINVLP